jgi:hypothetical protein
LTEARLEQDGLQDSQIGGTACISAHHAGNTLEPKEGGDDCGNGAKSEDDRQPPSTILIVCSARQREAKGARTEYEDAGGKVQKSEKYQRGFEHRQGPTVNK